jgi:hypothetical protein
MPVEFQKVSDLLHVIPSDIMPIPKADSIKEERTKPRQHSYSDIKPIF